MRTFIILLTVLLSYSTLNGQTKPNLSDSVTAFKLFQQAKEKFARFEKEHGGYIQTKNVRMHYLTWGKPSGVPLIWIHGTGLSAYELLPLSDSLTKAGYYIIAIDYYAHGFTPIPKHEVSIYHVADDIKVLMDKLKIKKAVIGGYSRGELLPPLFMILTLREF